MKGNMKMKSQNFTRATEEQQIEKATSEKKKRGRKKEDGVVRFNCYLREDLANYAETMSRVSGMSMAAFLNLMIERHKEEHNDTYAAALAFREKLK